MNTLSVFLGSSFHLSSERILIGDGIRKLSDLWEQKGVRIHLLVWEDYRSEYTGQSKQKEYDRNLVQKSDIVFAMFRDDVGKWTEHELDVAISSKKDIYCFSLPNKDKGSVIATIANKGLDVIEVNNGQTILDNISSIIEQFINTHNLTSANTATFDSKCLYATIPSDMKSFRPRLGNIVRSLDMIAENQLNLRLRLHPYHESEYISSGTDHYLALLNTVTNRQEEEEFKRALDALSTHQRMAAISVFKKSGGKVLTDNRVIGPILRDKEIFTVSIGEHSTDRLSLKLLLWLYTSAGSNKAYAKYIDSNDANIAIHNGKITFFGRPVADVSSFDNEGRIKLLLEKKAKLEEEICCLHESSVPDKNNRLFTLSSQINSYSNRIKLLTIFELNTLLYNQFRSAFDSSQDIDAEGLIEASELEAETLEDLQKYLQGDLNDRLDAILGRIEYLRNNISSDEDIEKLSRLADAHNRISQTAYVNNLIGPELLMESLMYSVRLSDTFFNGRITYDEDGLYERIVALSNTTGITSPMVEMMRMNLGNAYARKGMTDCANICYRRAIGQFMAFEFDSPASRRNLAHLYITAIHHAIETSPHNPELKRWTSNFMRLSAGWYESDERYIVERAIALTCYLSELEFSAYIGKEEALESERLIDSLMAKPILKPEDDYYGEIYCFFPIIIGRYYLEQYGLVRESDQMSCYNKTEKYLNISLACARELESVNYQEYLVYSADVNHNLGFWAARSNLLSAVSYYREALWMRRVAYESLHIPSDENSIAETLINLCWAIIYCQQDAVSLPEDEALPENTPSMAKEALDIYTRHLKKGELGSETRFYTALLLNGYINLGVVTFPSFVPDNDYGALCIRQCVQWDKQNPNNDQHARINAIEMKLGTLSML